MTDIVSRIARVDLSSVMMRLAQKYHWDKPRIMHGLERYRLFLCQCAASDMHVSRTPDADIDAVWQEHVLGTRRYALDCETVFGRFIHYDPVTQESADMFPGLRDEEGRDRILGLDTP